eukprot:gene19630-20079_t
MPMTPTIDERLNAIRGLTLNGRHAEALEAAEALVNEAPGHRELLYAIAANQRCLGQPAAALLTLDHLEQAFPDFGRLYQERAYCHVMLRQTQPAIAALSRAVQLNPALTASWHLLEQLHRARRDGHLANIVAAQRKFISGLPPAILQATGLLADGDLEAAAALLAEPLQAPHPHEEAVRLIARIERLRLRPERAERWLRLLLESAPQDRAALADLASALIELQCFPQARTVVDRLLALDADDDMALALDGSVCAGLGDHEGAVVRYRVLIARAPDSASWQVLLGHSLKALGRPAEAVKAYYCAAGLRPGFGDACWSLANLKTYRFKATDIARMQEQAGDTARAPADRIHFCFALGKAHEDDTRFAEAWQWYQRGNALQRDRARYRPELFEAEVQSLQQVCTATFFAERSGYGVPAVDPVFIVGLPRSGSTLVEQILCSHSQVESVGERADMTRLAREVADRHPDARAGGDVQGVSSLVTGDARLCAQAYLDAMCAYRQGRPLFVDKMPNNFRLIGLIHLLLPRARIIEVRREPMACCVANFRQLYAGGQDFSYSIDDLAHYYRHYLALMRHWDRALPGRVLRVCYEDVVADLEGSVDRILRHCSLPFEQGCLEFHKTVRSIATPSSEQVRQPIYREGLDQWRNFEPWLKAVTRYERTAASHPACAQNASIHPPVDEAVCRQTEAPQEAIGKSSDASFRAAANRNRKRPRRFDSPRDGSMGASKIERL